jgi:hypothetical protein
MHNAVETYSIRMRNKYNTRLYATRSERNNVPWRCYVWNVLGDLLDDCNRCTAAVFNNLRVASVRFTAIAARSCLIFRQKYSTCRLRTIVYYRYQVFFPTHQRSGPWSEKPRPGRYILIFSAVFIKFLSLIVFNF